MAEFKNKELAAYLNGAVQLMLEHEPESAVFAARLPDGQMMTGYYKAEAEDKAVIAHHIYADALLDTVLNNIEFIRGALDELEDD